MSKVVNEQLMNYLTPHRMASVANLASHFQCSLEEIIPILRNLIFEGRLRLSTSRCAGGCASCQRCQADTAEPTITGQTIAISLEKRETDE